MITFKRHIKLRSKKFQDIQISRFFLEYDERNNCATTFVLIDYIRCMRRFSLRSRRRKSSATRSLGVYHQKKNDRIEKLREAELFAGMEMAVDFDLTRRNLITLRTGLRGSETRNEASRRSRDDNVKVRYEFHRRSFPSEGFSICRYSEKDRRRSSPFA